MKCLSFTVTFTVLSLSMCAAGSRWSQPSAASQPPGATGQLVASEYNPPGRGGGYPGGTRFDQEPPLDDTSHGTMGEGDPGQAPLT